MATLTTPCAGMFFLSGDRFGRVAFQFSGRRKEFAARVKPSLQPLLLGQSPGFPNGKRGRGRGRGGEIWAEEELGGRYELEAEIYGFMAKSENPSEFPSKEALIAAGREDLAIAIAKEGGWLAYGWNLDEEENGKHSRGVSNLAHEEPCEEDWITSPQETPSVAVEACLNDDSYNHSACSEGSSRSSSSRRPMETEASENLGIEGILIRLEKERTIAFGFLLQKDKKRKIAKEQNRTDVVAGHSNVSFFP
ncbi:hypothetical protein HPP92_018242 [Vanilla planifolia]|uniref:Uncharacterized protein n=1 Tax=Vanilla planifolia TaxID=51239 RepID=A0A835QG06_VANPL|nr:hypothetical protein HPP92_018242 [Vanilla planifolia]